MRIRLFLLASAMVLTVAGLAAPKAQAASRCFMPSCGLECCTLPSGQVKCINVFCQG
ncbi:MAG TPA: hypothetical protein VF173_01610 [Thermoanaerobaculia bacterium]|nr:hypothetical protein [Thermoanaerobaculia bacterium]